MKLSIARDITITPMEAGAVILDGRRGRYWQLNGTGAVVLHSLSEGGTLESAAELLAANSSVSLEQAMADARALVDSLVKANLVEVAP
jgi:hypothetical protein